MPALVAVACGQSAHPEAAAGAAAGGGAAAGAAGAASSGGGAAGAANMPPAVVHASWPMPNPPGIGLPNPAEYDIGPGVVVDEVTGLIWQEPDSGKQYTQE